MYSVFTVFWFWQDSKGAHHAAHDANAKDAHCPEMMIPFGMSADVSVSFRSRLISV